MKKIISLVTIFTFLFCLAGCSNDTNSNEGSLSSSVKSEEETSANSDEVQTSGSLQESINQAEEAEPEETGVKALIVYFSHSGNTESVAEEIQNQTGADIFEIIPETPYTDDYNTLLDVAQDEKRNDACPSISGTIENIENYDIIYLGYPNWLAYHKLIQCTQLA